MTEPSRLGQREPAFSFVVVADTHINESEHTSTSPFETNHRANSRARYVFEEIAAMEPQPRFVVHLGDIVHPVPSLPAFHDAVANFKAIAAPLTVPLHVIPGNHDVGDKTIDWMPADQVCDAYLATYREAFGQDYFSFDEGGLRFIMLNSLLLNSGLDDEVRQRDWFVQLIDSADGLRVFVFMHYPPFIYSANERGSYDNIDEPARAWLLGQLRRPAVEAVFAGHVHNFWYDRLDEAQMYMLPSTAFLRHDFAEFARIAPGFEFGRGDEAKFGYFRVDVYDDDHVAYAVRSMGRQSAPGEHPRVRSTPPLAHPRTSGFDQVGVELRHPWAEVMQITATGGVQEFGRKWARNDYPLLALWEMGTRLAKVPDIDLLEDEPRARMKLMHRLGQQHIVTVLGAPRRTLLSVMDKACGVVAVEANITLEGFARQRESLRAARTSSGAMIYLAKILADSASHFDGKTFSHFVKSGFSVDELERHRKLIVDSIADGVIDGITVRVEMHEALPAVALRLRQFHDATACRILVSLKLAGASLATARVDDRETVARAAQAMVLSRCARGISYVFDTFMDVDRGYFPRNAFIDRRFNPRPAAAVFTLLAARYQGSELFSLTDADEHVLRFDAHGQSDCLVCGPWSQISDLLANTQDDAPVLDLFLGESMSAAEFTVAAQRDPEAIHTVLIGG